MLCFTLYKAKMAMRPARPAPAIFAALFVAEPAAAVDWGLAPDPEPAMELVADSAPERRDEATVWNDQRKIAIRDLESLCT